MTPPTPSDRPAARQASTLPHERPRAVAASAENAVATEKALPPQPRSQRGFTLLEAIVALVIFSLVAASLYAWQNSNFIAIQRAVAHARQNHATRSALAVVADVNPMLAPTGTRSLGADTVRWTATLVSPARDGATAIGMPDLFKIGLYTMHVEVLSGQQVVAAFQVRQTGYRQVHKLEQP